MDRITEETAEPSSLYELVQKYAHVLQGIYDDRTAADATFTGVLGDFAAEVRSLPERDTPDTQLG